MRWDAIVVGAGPNGLAAAIELARHGLRVLVREAAPTVGGAARTEELTLPGFLHDAGSAVYPLGVGSPFLSSLPLADHGLEWVQPDLPLAHPLDGGTAVALHRSLDETVVGLGADGAAYRRLVAPFLHRWSTFVRHVTDSPLRPPRSPVLMARFGLRALRPATSLARAWFRGGEARALLAGSAAHTGIPLDRPPTAGVATVLKVAAHAVGWPFPRGGAGALTRSLASYLESLGGAIETDAPVGFVGDLPDARAVLLALTPRQVLSVAGDRLPHAYAARMRAWSYGPAAFKMDWALDGPIPWSAPACRRAGTVHVGGTLDEVAEAEATAWTGGETSARPFVIVAQPSLFDSTRAPPGKHTAWAYCHVPLGSTTDMSARIEGQIERFAPGFRRLILAKHVRGPVQLETWNASLVGGDVNGGTLSLRQTLARPVLSSNPWTTPVQGLYLCSSSTPPGGGVHGMCGYHAARAALARTFRK